MGQRNMLYTGPMLDMEMEQHAHLRPEPCVVPYGGIASFPQPNNTRTILAPPGNRTSFDAHHLPENHGPLPYGITQYTSVDHHHSANNIERCNTFMTPPPSARVFPVPINHGLHDQLAYSSNHGSFERNGSQFVDGFNGAFKRKSAEGFPGNFQYFYPAPGSSSSVAVPMSTEGTLMDASSFMIPEYRGNTDIPLVMDGGLHRSVRNRAAGAAIGVEPVPAHNNNHLIPGNYGGQPLQAVPTWLDQQFCGNGSDTGAFSWNQAPGIPYLQGCINGGGIDAANMGLHGYQVTASNRSSVAFLHPPPVPPHQGHHNLHHPPPPPMPPLRGHNMDFHTQVASTSRRLPTNSSTSYNSVNPFQNGVEPGPRFMAPPPPTALRVYRPQRREVMVESTARHRSFPHLRVLPEDGVAILDISDYHEGHAVDHHRDMRLDIDHMSYEELLALGEQIGSVGSGLSDDFILNHLKTRTFVLSKSASLPEDSSSADQELNFCVVCQTDYNDQEKIGVLDCGHEYHVDCIKKWLIVKNTCPVCKSAALITEGKSS